MASGLLPIAVEDGTKFVDYIASQSKTYDFIIQLGAITDTADKFGNVTKSQAIKAFTGNQLEHVCTTLIGKQLQTPPIYSALKVRGKAMYRYARDNIPLPTLSKQRNIEIYNLIVNEVSSDTISLTAQVSKGTYIRTLGETIAEQLGNLGHLIALRRTKIGNLSLKKSVLLENEFWQLQGNEQKITHGQAKYSIHHTLQKIENNLLAIDKYINLPSICISVSQSKDISFGRNIQVELFDGFYSELQLNQSNKTIADENGNVKLYCNNTFIGIGKNLSQPVTVFPTNQNHIYTFRAKRLTNMQK